MANMTQSCNSQTCIGHDTCVCVSNTTSGVCQDKVSPPPPIITCENSPSDLTIHLQNSIAISLENNPVFVWANATRVAIQSTAGKLYFYSGSGHNLINKFSLESGRIVYYMMDTNLPELMRSTQLPHNFGLEVFNVDKIYRELDSTPLRKCYNLEHVEDFVLIRLLQSKLIGLVQFKNSSNINNLNFKSCGTTVAIPSFLNTLPGTVIAALEVDPVSLCVTKLLSSIITDSDTSEYDERDFTVIPCSSGIVVKSLSDSRDKLILKKFETYELLQSTTRNPLYHRNSMTFKDVEAHVTIDDKNQIILVGTLYYSLRESTSVPIPIPSLSSLHCGTGGHPKHKIRSFHSQGNNYFFVSNLCSNTTSGVTATNTLLKLDGVELLWSKELAIPSTYNRIIDFYEDSSFERYHLLLQNESS